MLKCIIYFPINRTDAELFIGFKPAIEACYLDWEEYPIPGITHTHDTNPIYYSPFTCFKHTESKGDAKAANQLNATQALMSNNKHYNYISSSDHGSAANMFKQRFERPFRERFYISSSNSSSDSVHARLSGNVGGEPSTSSAAAAVNNASLMMQAASVPNNRTNEIAGQGGSNASSAGLNIKTNAAGLSSASGQVRLPMVGGGSAGDGNRSSASSEGFCENEDFGGDSSSNNLCGPQEGRTLEPAEISKKSEALAESDSQGSLTVSSASSSHVVMKSSYPTAKTNEANAVTPLTSSSSSSTSSMLMAEGSIASTSNALTQLNAASAVDLEKRRLSKDESLSSSSDEFVIADVNATSSSNANANILSSMPSTSAAARSALLKSNAEASKDTTKIPATAPVVNAESLSAASSSAATGAAVAASSSTHSAAAEKPHIFSNIRPTEDAWDILLARAEGLHAHGHGREACILAVRLAEEMLANPPNLMVELPPAPKRKGKNKNINPISHQLTVLASATLSKCAFLCTVLSENSEHYHIGFRICLFALEMARPPASTKPLEVKLANQEADILALLKKIPLDEPELKVIRERAEYLRCGNFKTRGEALLPINLATFIFDALVMPMVKEQRSRMMNLMYRTPADENLGFEAAVAALGLKTNVSEAEHPLLCEGTRRQRGDLALTLLYYYKDEPRKIAKIMEKLLDREIHTLLKTPLLPAYYSNNPPVRTPASAVARHREEQHAEYGSGGNSMHGSSGSCMNEMFHDYSSVGGNSRPHSSTSAELEVGMGSLNISSPSQGGAGVMSGVGGSSAQGMVAGSGPQAAVANQASGAATGRSKDSRYKGKRAYPSIPNQPSEASAHFMFELAKNVLTKAGGNSSTSLFTQASTNQNHHGPHRALHMCAFQLGLYALGLHNCVSPNWLSRTYSSHVSWILGQAIDIGAPAISFLIDTWEGHLTPPEAAGMADRASRGWDSNMVYPAAELALSVLPHAAALNPNEIQRAILQCKEQSDHMLERACITVENAAKGGGVYPEVLFQVARYWYELYLRNTPNSENEQHDDHLDHHSAVSLSALIESQQQHHEQMQAAQACAQQVQQQQVVASNNGQGMPQGPPPTAQVNTGPVVVSSAQQAFQQGVAALAPLSLSPYQPYSFCPSIQGIYHHNIPTYPPNQMQMYIPPPPQAYPGYASTPQQQQAPPPGQAAGVVPQQPPQFAAAPFQQIPPQLPPQAYQGPPAYAAQPGQVGSSQIPPQNMQQVAAAAAAVAYYGQAPPPHPSAVAAVQQQMQRQQQQQQQHSQAVYPFVHAQQIPPMASAQQQPQQPQPPSVRQRHPHQFT